MQPPFSIRGGGLTRAVVGRGGWAAVANIARKRS